MTLADSNSGRAAAEEGRIPIAPAPYGPIEASSQFEFQTSFEEGWPGRNAGPINQTALGIPGFPVTAIGHQMRVRYSEFELRWRIVDGQSESPLYIQPNFRQRSPEGWLPGAITEFDHDGIHYRIGHIVSPASPQPVDLYTIELKNTTDTVRRGALKAMFDGAPTLKAEGDLIADRGKPLALLVPPSEKIDQVWRDHGVVDSRATPFGAWTPPGRTGWYGQPIEYMIKSPAASRIALVFRGTPGIAGFPPSVWPVPDREITAQVEGDTTSQTLKVNKAAALEFNGRDTDGDGYIRISVRATPGSRQPAILNDIYVFPEAGQINHEKLIAGTPETSPTLHIPCGADRPRAVQETTEGVDPTVASLQLSYAPELKPGESRSYEIRLPAIDKPELQTYGNPFHPYDTGDSLRDCRDARHPENTAPYGEDVPPGRTAEDFAIFGPKDRAVWDAQLANCRQINWSKGLAALKDFWEKRFANIIQFDLPEPEIADTCKHQLAMLDLYTQKLSGNYAIMMGGAFFYWDFCYRDGATQCVAFDMAGMHDLTRLQFNAYLTPRSKMPRTRWTMGQWDTPDNDGLWMTRSGQLDAQGQNLWALYQHAMLSQDSKWLAESYPAIRRGAEWIVRAVDKEKKRLKDPNHVAYGLLPEGEMEGNPWGHALYFNAYAALGLECTADLAAKLGKTEDVTRYRQESAALRAAIQKAVHASFRRRNHFVGAVPVAPEQPKDLSAWPMSMLVYGDRLLPAHDVLIDAAWKHREADAMKTGGLMDWPYIHLHWALGYMDRGEPDRCVQLFYAYLSLASGTLDWGEWHTLNKVFTEFTPPLVAAEADSDMPHQTSCCNYVIFLRSILLREMGDELLVAPASPRKWLAPGQHFAVKNAPTHFGRANCQITSSADGQGAKAEITLEGNTPPKRMVVSLRGPQSRGIRAARVNGKPTDAFLGDCVVVPEPRDKVIVEAEFK